MKAITLTQPYATLIAIGAKQIETRSWHTSYRGPLAIHAAASLSGVGGKRGYRELCSREPFRSALSGVESIPLGEVIATCELIECVRIVGAIQRPVYVKPAGYIRMPPDEPERSFGDYTPGRYAWILADVMRLANPIPAKGALGLWEWKFSMPEEAMAETQKGENDIRRQRQSI